MANEIRTRCGGCNAMCLPNKIASVPNENMQLCEDCAKVRGFDVQHAADGSFELTHVYRWWTFTAYNTEARYGFGTELEASRFCVHLNLVRDINVYSYDLVDAELSAALDGPRDDGFNLSDELAGIEDETEATARAALAKEVKQ